jgi:CheY-like chemotaxis protein
MHRKPSHWTCTGRTGFSCSFSFWPLLTGGSVSKKLKHVHGSSPPLLKNLCKDTSLLHVVNGGVTTFLLVEDEPNDVALVQMEFAKAPFPIRLYPVGDGSEAIDYIEGRGKFANRKEYPMPDVVLLDLKMPRVSGFDFLKWLRTESPNSCHLIPVVVMSSSSLEEDVDRAYGLGANSYLVKPVDWVQFRERIKALGIYWAWHSQTPQAPHAH